MENTLDIFGEYGNKNKMYTLPTTLMQKLFGVAEPGPGEESQFVSLVSTLVCRESSREFFKEELERAIMTCINSSYSFFHYSKPKQKNGPKQM